jgi:hypothetical protein
MSALRKLVLSAATLFLGLAGMFLVTANAAAAGHGYTVQCDEDWHLPCH